MNAESERRLRSFDWGLLLLAAIPLFLQLGKVQVWGSEGRWLMVTQGMRESGDYFVPRLDGEAYPDKPVLGYWAIAWGAWCHGSLDEWAGRIPSAIAGLATILLTGWIGARLLGRKAGLLAGILLGGSYSFFVWSRTASSDALELSLISAALAVYVASKDGFRSWHGFAFFSLLGLGGQVKGMPGVVLPVCVVLADAFFSRRRELLEHKAQLLLALLFGALIYFLPFLIAWARGGDLAMLRSMWKENFLRAFSAFDHNNERFYYYAWVLPLMLMPWGLWIPGALTWAVKRWKHDSGLRFALVAFAVIFLVLSASQSRRSYYILPIFPWACILTAALWVGLGESAIAGGARPFQWKVLGDAPFMIWGTLSVVLGALLLLAPWLPERLASTLVAIPGRLALGALLAVGPIAVWRAGDRMGKWPACLATASLGVFLSLYLATGGEALRAGFLTEKPLVEEMRRRFPKEAYFYCGFDRENFEFYADTENDFSTSEELCKILEEKRKKNDAGGLLVACAPKTFESIRMDPRIHSEILYRAATIPLGELFPPKEQYLLVRFR